MADLGELAAAIEAGDRASAVRLTNEALAAFVPPQEILDAMTGAMGVIGRQFQDGDIFVPEMLIAARAMKGALALLEPILSASSVAKPRHLALIGTVKGDLHDIGKDLVAAMWKGADIAVIDLGVDVAAETFAEATIEHRPDIVGMSALLTTTMRSMREATAAVRATGVPVRIIVGGAPISDEFAADIRADGWALDAGMAVDVARRLLAEPAR